MLRERCNRCGGTLAEDNFGKLPHSIEDCISSLAARMALAEEAQNRPTPETSVWDMRYTEAKDAR